MKSKKEQVIRIMIPLFFLFVILGLNAAGYYDRTYYAWEPEMSFSLDRGRYRVVMETAEPVADSYCVYYEVIGQEHILAQGDMKCDGAGCVFEMELPSNIRNDSLRVELSAGGERLTQIDVMRITRILPIRETAVYLALYFALMLLLAKGFGGGREALMLTGFVSVALLPLYQVFCAAPVRTAALIVTGVSLIFLADRKTGIARKSIIRYVFFLMLSLAALYFCTESSPFYVRNPWDDVSIYYSIGRGITQGYVPYRDMFDHKGPVVFFLFALGHLLTPDRFYGVYLLESLCFSGVLYFAYKTGRLYFDESIAEVLAVSSMIFLLDGSFLGYGGSCEEFTMVIYAAILYMYLAYFSGRKECTVRQMAGAGVLCGLSFWMKFNMTVCLLVLLGMVMLHRLLGGRSIIKDIAAFAGGMAAVSVPVTGYFVCADSIGYFKNSYFDANLAYADVQTMQETIAAFGRNVLTAVTDNPGITLLVMVGILGFLISSRYIGNIAGKIGLVMAFGVLVGSTYISYAYLYYYCLVAVFVLLGIIFIAGLVTGRRGGSLRESTAWWLALPCLCILLVFNQNHRQGAVFSENFSLYDVCELEIEHAGQGQDKTLLLYHNHWAQMMTYPNVKPVARYYFAPNISKKIPEINEEQDRYIHEGWADLVLVDNVDLYPSLEEWGLYRYEQIMDWRWKGYSVQLYRRK